MAKRTPLQSTMHLEDLRKAEAQSKLKFAVSMPPPKPNMTDFAIDDADVRLLRTLDETAHSNATKIRWSVFALVTVVILLIMQWSYFPFTLIPGFISLWATGALFKLLKKRTLAESILESKLNDELRGKRDRYHQYLSSMAKWRSINRDFERALSRGVHAYWLSKTGVELEEAVADLFSDLGFEVQTTPASGDQGIDLILKKDGSTSVVQCKALGKPCGPAIVRETFGAMHAFKADEAMVICPRGFTQASIEFAKDKPIQLLTVDELATALYAFESYTPHWVASVRTVDDLNREVRRRYLPRHSRQ